MSRWLTAMVLERITEITYVWGKKKVYLGKKNK